MRRARFIAFLVFCILCLCVLNSSVYSHTVNYNVQGMGIAVRVFYSTDDPASYSQYEVYGPGDSEPHQTGRTDKNGFVAFVPDRSDIWKIKVLGESTHGFHGVTTQVKVDEALNLKSFSKPLVAIYTRLVIEVSLIFRIFGLYSLVRSRKRREREVSNHD